MQSPLLLLFCTICAVISGEESIERIVRSPQGPVRGYKDQHENVFVFYGIPYATVPKGRYKYWPSYPPSAWLTTFDAVDKGVICPQASADIEFPGKTMQEDCLIANVYVPNTDRRNLPVVVYVHGGAYQVGFADLETPKKLVSSQKIIAVTFNYRLGVHGFLCLGTKDVPGNAGIKDQVQLLKWVQKNIASYGGNPDEVTIAGYSAGSSSVDLLMLSPSAKGLFNKVIPESGASLAAFSIQSDPLHNAKQYARTLGFDKIDDLNALEEFYKSASIEDLTKDSFMDRPDSTFMFSPCIEHSSANAPFLTESPNIILKEGKYKKVPLLYGFAEMEGLFRLPLFEVWKTKMNENFSAFLPADLTFENEEQRDKVVKDIKTFYFNDKPVGDDNIVSYIDYFTDVIFAFPTLRAVKLHAEAGHDKVYLYEYNFVDESTPVIPHTKDKKGADHCAETVAVLDGKDFFDNDETNITPEFSKMKATIRELWINFITTGNPVPPGSSLPAWQPANGAGSPHMSLGSTLELRGALLERRVRFWHDLYNRHYREPIPPPAAPHHTEL